MERSLLPGNGFMVAPGWLLIALFLLGLIALLILLVYQFKSYLPVIRALAGLGVFLILILSFFRGLYVSNAREIALSSIRTEGIKNDDGELSEVKTVQNGKAITQSVRKAHGDDASRQHENGSSNVLMSAEAATSPEPPPSPELPPAPAKKTATREEELAQAFATKAVGVLRSLTHAFGRALAEEEKNLASVKGPSQPAAESEKPVQRPAWIDAPAQVVGDAYQMSLTIGPYTTRAECDAKLPEELDKAVAQYVEVCLGGPWSGKVRLPVDYLQRHVVKDQWEEVRKYTVGPMVQLHVLLQFDRKAKDFVLEAHRQTIVARRLQVFGGWAVLGLLALGVAFAYLRIDLSTGGIYRGRLRFAAAAVILGLAAVAVTAIS